MLKSDTPKDKRTISPVEAILEAWRRTISRLGLTTCFPPYDEKNVEQLYMRAHANARIGKLEMSAQQFATVSRMVPSFGDAFQGHGEILDRMGRFELASRNYDIARRLRQEVRQGPPDRCSVVRHRRTFAADIAAYTAVLRSRPSKQRALTYLARGNAYLASGHAKLALIDYGFVLRLAPKPEVVALRAEALTHAGTLRGSTWCVRRRNWRSSAGCRNVRRPRHSTACAWQAWSGRRRLAPTARVVAAGADDGASLRAASSGRSCGCPAGGAEGYGKGTIRPILAAYTTSQ